MTRIQLRGQSLGLTTHHTDYPTGLAGGWSQTHESQAQVRVPRGIREPAGGKRVAVADPSRNQCPESRGRVLLHAVCDCPVPD